MRGNGSKLATFLEQAGVEPSANWSIGVIPPALILMRLIVSSSATSWESRTLSAFTARQWMSLKPLLRNLLRNTSPSTRNRAGRRKTLLGSIDAASSAGSSCCGSHNRWGKGQEYQSMGIRGAAPSGSPRLERQARPDGRDEPVVRRSFAGAKPRACCLGWVPISFRASTARATGVRRG